MHPNDDARVVCAVDTRNSTAEGLEQEFNTLDAQREASGALDDYENEPAPAQPRP